MRSFNWIKQIKLNGVCNYGYFYLRSGERDWIFEFNLHLNYIFSFFFFIIFIDSQQLVISIERFSLYTLDDSWLLL